VRIAFTHAYCWPEVRRGAERFIPELSRALTLRGHEVVQFSAAWQPGREVVDGFSTVRLRRRYEDPDRHEADFGRRLLPRLIAGGFDAVHSLGRRDAVASIRAARLHPGRRTVYTDLGLPMRAQWEGRPQEARAVEKVVAGIDVYSGMSQCAVDYLVREYGREDGVVVPGGVDLSAFVPAPAREPRPTILFSGAFNEPHKEVSLLLDALAMIAESQPEVELWLSGPGEAEPLLSAAKPAARDRTRVLGVGEANRQHERYGRAWLTCLPSRFDSFGMALVESLACGTPLVTTTQGAPKELVSEGVTGELCRPGDAEELAGACLRAFDLARRPETVEACRASAAPFDWERGLAPLVERLYAPDGDDRQ
jgi:glycosyltransferase involved in cell wall biosynthesis